jgi:hypothetical protein
VRPSGREVEDNITAATTMGNRTSVEGNRSDAQHGRSNEYDNAGGLETLHLNAQRQRRRVAGGRAGGGQEKGTYGITTFQWRRGRKGGLWPPRPHPTSCSLPPPNNARPH